MGTDGKDGTASAAASAFAVEDLREKLEREQAERKEEREGLEADLRRERSATANANATKELSEKTARSAKDETARWRSKHAEMEAEVKQAREQLRLAELEIISLRDRNATQAMALRESRS